MHMCIHKHAHVCMQTFAHTGGRHPSFPCRGLIYVKQILSLSSIPTLNRHSWWRAALSHNQDFLKIISCLDYILRLSPWRAETLRSFGQAYTGTRIKDAQTNCLVMWCGLVSSAWAFWGYPKSKDRDLCSQNTSTPPWVQDWNHVLQHINRELGGERLQTLLHVPIDLSYLW